MSNKKKLLFLIPELDLGGSQKVLSILLRNISLQDYDVTLCVLTSEGVFYNTIPDEIFKINLKLTRVRYSAFRIYKTIRKRKPDLVFVFDVNHLSLLVALVSWFLPRGIKYVTRESVVLSTFLKNYSGVEWILKRLYIRSFKRFDLVICQSQYMREDLVSRFFVSKAAITIINNPIEVDKLALIDMIKPDTDLFQLVAVGRIVYVKGFDLLIQAVGLLKNKNIHLTIIGEKTPENPGYKESIMNLVEELGLQEKILFLGFSANPHNVLVKKDLLVISSRTEAFSNVAIEANALGVPVLAFNSPGGMREIIEEGVNGWLVENGNIELLAKAIDKAMTIKLKRTEIARVTREKYGIARIMPQYTQAINNVLKM